MSRDAVSFAVVDDATLVELIAAVVAGEPGAWPTLWTLVEPKLARLAGSPRVMGRLSGDEDEQRNIYTELAADQLAALEKWLLGSPFDHIADELELDSPKAAERLVRAALQRLRRQFRKGRAA